MSTSALDPDLTKIIIDRMINPHIQTIIQRCHELCGLFEQEPNDEIIEDLKKIVVSAELMSEKIELLKVTGLPDSTPDNTQLFAKIRHDLRTPLNAIFGYADIIAEYFDVSENPQHHQHYSTIRSAANALLQAVDSINENELADSQPLTSGESSNPKISSQLQRINRQSTANKQTGRLLVVDDVEENRVLLERQLSSDGHSVAMAESGAVAMEMIKQQAFDLILLDIMMPGVNGLEVLENLKGSESHRQIPIIVISGLDDMDAVAPCIAAGAEDYLTKPFNPVLLRARINSSLQKKKWLDRERDYIAQIEHEKKRTDAIMQAVLPSAIIDRLKHSDEPVADRLENVSVMFADIVGFTAAAEQMTPEELLAWLDGLFSEFDRLSEEHGVEKIKTIGDAYMVACGAPLPREDHIDRILHFASSILAFVNSLDENTIALRLRIGIHTGPVVAGLVGRHRYVYDLWGETVNTASRIETSGVENRISVSTAIAEQASACFSFESRGEIKLKGIGSTEVLMLVTENKTAN